MAGLEAQEIAVRMRLLDGTAFQAEADRTAESIDRIGAAGDEASAGIGKMNDKVGESAGAAGLLGFFSKAGAGATALGAKMEKLGKSMMSFGRSASVFSAVIGIGIGESAKSYMKVEEQYKLLETQAKASRSEIEKLHKATKGWGKEFGLGPEEVAKALYPIQSVFKNFGLDMKTATAAAMGAVVGKDTMENTANFLTSVRKSGLAGSMSEKQIMALGDEAVGQGKMRLPELSEALGKSGIIALAKTDGLNLQGLLSYIAGASAQGVEPSELSNRLKLTLNKLLSPHGEALSAVEGLGLTQYQMAEAMHSGQLGPVKVLKLLEEHLKLVSANEQNLYLGAIFGQSRGQANIATLLRSIPSIEKIFGVLGKTNAGVLEKHFTQAKEAPGFQFEQVKGTLKEMEYTLGKAAWKPLADVLKTLEGFLSKITTWFSKLSPSTQKFLTWVLLATAALGPLSLVFGSMFLVVGKLLPLLLVDLPMAFKGLMTFAIANPFLVMAAAVVYILYRFKLLMPALKLVISGYEKLYHLGQELGLIKEAKHREVAPNRLASQMAINNARLRVEAAHRHFLGDASDEAFLKKNGIKLTAFQGGIGPSVLSPIAAQKMNGTLQIDNHLTVELDGKVLNKSVKRATREEQARR